MSRRDSDDDETDRFAFADSAGAAADLPMADDIITQALKTGYPDENGKQIQDIYWSTRKFSIYEADDQIRYLLPPNYDIAKGLRRRIAELGGLRASIENLRSESAVSPTEKKRAAREVAWALADAFEDDGDPPSDMPKDVLTRVDARLRSLVKSGFRRKYAIANLLAFLGIEVVLVALAFLLAFAWNPQEPLEPMSRYAVYAAFGALGAFLSVLTRLGSIEFNLDLKRWEHIFAGATRILIGVIGAVVIGLALDSGFMDPTFGHNDNDPSQVERTAPSAPEGEGDPTTVPEPTPPVEDIGEPAAPDPAAEQPAAPEAPAVAEAEAPEPEIVVTEDTASVQPEAEARQNRPDGLDSLLAMYLIFAFLAGFSESLVPSLLARGEQTAGGRSRMGSGDPIVRETSPS